MASMSEFPFVRRPRLASTPKIRPIMKLEWNKLLAEATEKDVELNKEPVDKESNYDDDVYELEEEGESGENINSGENNEEKPLNLCHKSHTLPFLGNKFQNPLEVVDLSAGKKAVEKIDNRRPESVKKNCSTVPNFQFNQVSTSDVASGDIIIENELGIENKENISNNNYYNKQLFSTPCNNKPSLNGKVIDEGSCGSCSIKRENQLGSRPVFFSEKKPLSSSLLEKAKIPIQEKNRMKVDFPIKTSKSISDEKKSCLKPDASIQNKPVINLQTSHLEKFAVPAEPPKLKESSKSLIINKKLYQILAPIGKGGSSKVYLVLNSENELLAVKCVKLSDVSESTKNDYLNEIQHLKKMQHSKHVIKLHDYQYLSSHKLLFAVMERGDTDLSRFLKDKASSDEGISPELIMYYWTEMLLAVKSIHENNIIHRDLKPANFLLVSGRLKLIDFGIASAIQTEQTSVLMESQSGTFNYMSPEALQDLGFENKTVLKIGRKTDVWSLGCILYSFLYKKTPYQDLVKPLQKMKAITDANYQVSFPKIPGVPDILIESCKRCLVHDTKKRASIEELLAFRNRPLLSLSQVLGKLENALSPEEYAKAAKAFEDFESKN